MTTRHKKFISWFASLVLLSLLAACSGADGDAARSPPFAGAAALRTSAQQASLTGTESRSHPLGVTATIDAESLLNWAESSYPLLFPRGPATQRMRADGVNYTLRHYPATGNYVGMADDGSVWGYGPFTGNILKSYGQMADYTCLVSPKLCEQAPVVCKTEITTGFSGDLNATYNVPDVGGDGASGDGGGGSAGAGGSEGKVLGGRIKVIRLSDGVELGEGVTDSTLGLTTIKWCKQDMPVMLELRGAPGAKYFDEAVNDLVDFPIAQKLRALVDKFDENVGVSALTEAAYLYAMNNLVNDPSSIASGKKTLVTDGVPVGLTAVQVQQANERVLLEVNRRLDASQALNSVRSLATPIDKTSTAFALPRNRFGQIAALHGGIAKVSKSYAFRSATPALDKTRQLALDMSDGVIDDYGIDRKLVAKVSADITYQAKELSFNLVGGVGTTSLQFGISTTLPNGPNYLKGRVVYGTSDSYYLSKIRSIISAKPSAQGYSFDLHFLDNIVDITDFSNGPIFAVSSEGEVFGWGNVVCGALANGEPGSFLQSWPVKIPLQRKVRQMISGRFYETAVALTEDGQVYSWGNGSSSGLIGIDPRSQLAIRKPCQGLSKTTATAIVSPVQIENLPAIRLLRQTSDSAMAVDFEGNVFRWGTSQTRTSDAGFFSSPMPARIASLPGLRDVVGYLPSYVPIEQRRFQVFAIDSEYRVNLLGPTFDPIIGTNTPAQLAALLKDVEAGLRNRIGEFTIISGIPPATALAADDHAAIALNRDGSATLLSYDGSLLGLAARFATYRSNPGAPGDRLKLSDTPPRFVRLQLGSSAGNLPKAVAVADNGAQYIVDCQATAGTCVWLLEDFTNGINLPSPY